MQRIAPLKPAEMGRCVICLDGIAEFIPEPEQLPPGFYLLLTSRPESEMPAHVSGQLAGKFLQPGLFARYRLELPEPGQPHDGLVAGYLQLLDDYFQRELKQRILGDLHTAMEAVVRQAVGPTLSVRGDDLKRRLPQAFRDRIQQDWQALTQHLTLSAGTDPRLGADLLQPVLARYQRVYALMLQKAAHRFLYFAHLVELFKDRKLEPDSLENLPEAGGLYPHYLEQLQRLLGGHQSASKPWEFTRRLLLTLAAAEQANAVFQSYLPVANRSTVFAGVPLSILAQLMVEPAHSTSTRLLFTLYTVKESLAVWKGEAARDSSYALGLKDLLAALQAQWPEALQEQQQKLANALFAALDKDWQAVTLDDAFQQWALRYGFAHARLSGDTACIGQWDKQDCTDCLLAVANAAYAKSRYRQGLELYSANIAVLETGRELLPPYWTPIIAEDGSAASYWCSVSASNDLAMAYTNRGVVHRGRQDFPAALADFGEAIGLMETLHARLGGEWPPAWAEQLAYCYENREGVYQAMNDKALAENDRQKAAEIRLWLVNRSTG